MPVTALKLAGIEGNLTLTGQGATAWYRPAPTRWSFRSDTDRHAAVTALAQRYAQLVGCRLHLRVTSRPWSADDWASRWAEATPDPLPGWAGMLDNDREHLDRLTFSDKTVYLGVDLARSAMGRLPFGRKSETDRLHERLAELDAIVAGPGLDGRRATTPEVEWLVRRSVALGCGPPASPALPGAWLTEDLAELSDTATWSIEPYGRSVTVVASVGGAQVTRHVVMLTVGRMGDLPLVPWLARTDRLGFGVEWAVTVDVLPGRVVAKQATSAMLRIRGQTEHWRDHRLDPPFSLERARLHALEVSDEIERGMEGLSTRTDTWARLAVSGATEAEALARAAKVIDAYAPGVSIVHPADQYRLARECIPGEPLATRSYLRRLPVTTLAAGMPTAAGTVGHETGDYLGYTSSRDTRAVLWDPWYSQEVRERSGLTLATGGLGAGKSSLEGLLVWRSAMRGIPCTVLDPSGPLARLCALPELAEHSRHIDLLQAAPGVLNPFRVIADPSRLHFASVEEWRHATTMAEAQRRTLCADVLAQFLPAVIAEQAETLVALRSATRQVGGSTHRSPRDVLDVLAGMQGHAAMLAELLADVADLPAAQLIFPTGSDLDALHRDDALLTVVTMRGLPLPREGSDRKEWSTDEAMAVPLLHLAAWLVQQSIYQGDHHARKLIALDEAHVLSRIASGRQLLNTAARDSRKHDARIIFASQSTADLTGGDVGNLIDSVFVGRTEDPAAQADALRVLRVPQGVGYEEVLAGLSPHARESSDRSGGREFVFSDGMGGVERIAVDLDGLPAHVRTALDTTSAPLRLVSSGVR